MDADQLSSHINTALPVKDLDFVNNTLKNETKNIPIVICCQNYVELRFPTRNSIFYVDNGIQCIYSNFTVNISRSSKIASYKILQPNTKIIFGVSNASFQCFTVICPALVGGILYTQNQLKHITIPSPNSLVRQSVSSSMFPSSVANKFVSKMSIDEPYVEQNESIPEIYDITVNENKPTPYGDIVILQTTNSIIRVEVKKNEQPKIKSGYEIIAWTPGIQFTKSGIISKIQVASSISEGFIWIMKVK